MFAVDHIVEAFVDLNLDIISDGVRLSFYELPFSIKSGNLLFI